MSVDINPHHYDNMDLIFIQQILGSSYNLPAHGRVGQGKERKARRSEGRSPERGD